MDKVDFEASYKALDGFTHFHSETLRGKIRSFQLRTKEAVEHFRRAEDLSKAAEKSPTNHLRLFYLRFYSLHNAMVEEVLQESGEICLNTELEMQRFLDFEDPNTLTTDQIRILMIGHYQLLRGNYHSALEAFECLIEESRSRIEDVQVEFYCGACAASYALGFHNNAERHYENALMSLNFLSKTLKIAGAYSKLYTLIKHMGRADEAKEWQQALERLAIPKESLQHFLKLEGAYSNASAIRNRIVI
ncbi:MAG: hypothetical protein HY717_06715 [Planctomycetes bacterium]|nr:hypothetical protein [Planctomycetota bacterium]